MTKDDGKEDFHIRMRKPLKRALKREAKDQKRDMTGQLETILEERYGQAKN